MLGAILTGTKDIQEWVCSELALNDFSDLENQRAYKAIQTILEENLEVTQVSVKDRGRLKATTIATLLEAGTSVAPGQIKTIIRDLRTASQLRSLSKTFSHALSQCSTGDSPHAVLEAVEQGIYGLGGDIGHKASDAKDVARRAATLFCDKLDGKAPPAVSTGIRLLDRGILGYLPGKAYVLGARPSMGKSAVAQTSSHAVLEQGLGVITFTGEMTEEDCLNRSLAYYADVNVSKIISGKDLGPGEAARVLDAANKIPGDRWRIIDRLVPIGTMRRIARIEAAKMRRKGIQLGLIVVDYLQLYADGENREQAVSQVSGGCKKMANELECAVLALSQLNRGLEHRENKRPTMADLRESGAIEQDADVVMFLYREHVYNQSIAPEDAELIIGKNRHGRTGILPVRFCPKTTSFTDAALPSHVQPACPVETPNQ